MLSYISNFRKGKWFKTTYRVLTSLALVLSVILFTGFMCAKKIVTLSYDGKTEKFLTLETDVNKILRSKNVCVFDQDECKYEDNGHDMFIEIKRAINVMLVVDEEERYVSVSPCGKISDVFVKSGVEIGPDDIIIVDNSSENVNISEVVYDGMKIAVKRVSYKEREEFEEIDFEQEVKETDEIYEGETKVKIDGQKGERKRSYIDKFIDGKLVESSEKQCDLTKEPVKKVILKGTKKKEKPADPSASPPANYKRVISGKASAYTGGGYTSTGRKASRGLVAVDPRQIPYGSKLYITSYGYATAADCGGMMLNGSRLVDLYFDTEGECRRFGVRNVDIYIL